ncbi:MAG TPA: tripartite tricarboxylate transporter TctB family protein [Rhodocyclaceae bacterium]|nr:tripartite tricarboxylate transporter TctB family protein [Rhodocyclaceae bacterium]
MDFCRTQKDVLMGLMAPALFIAAAMLLTGFVDENPERTAAMTRGIFGPTSWPSYMLYGVIFFAAGWLLQDLLVAIWKYNTARRSGANPGVQRLGRTRAAPTIEARVLVGIALIGAYGYLIPTIGFAFATLLFFVIWMLIGGIRKPSVIGLVGTCGTLFLLYLFVKLAAMPLSRGEGVFADWTIALYQFLKVF